MIAKNGIICFTFDDRNFQGWINAMPIFEKYNAHASFFISGEIDDEALSAIKILYKAGHTIGLHTKNHSDAPEYFEKYSAELYFQNEIKEQMQKLKENGIDITSFAYPNNKRTEETDRFLSKYFKRFRAGNRDFDKKYIPVELLTEEKVMRGFGIGEYYNTIEEEILDKIYLAAKENLCITFFSHNILENASHIHMPTALLKKCLATAEKEDVRVLGFNQLP